MNNIINVIKNNAKFYMILSIIILLGIIGVTFSLIISSFNAIAINTNMLEINADISYDTNSNGEEVVSTGNMLPISDELVIGPNVSDPRVLKATFNVTGNSNNPENTIYDIALHNINVDCDLRTKDLKWRLYKGEELISREDASLSPTFDTMNNNRLVLTETQEDLTTSTDKYTFLLWISESCTGDITQCTSDQDQSKYLGKEFSASIKVELSTKSKKSINRITGSEDSCNYMPVEIPACNILTYNGSEQTLISTDSTNYILENTTGINAGTYKITAKLNDECKWSNGETEDKVLTCNIDKKDVTVTTLNQTITYGNNISSSVSNISSSELLTNDVIEEVTLSSDTVDVGTGKININNVKISKGNNIDVTSNYNIIKNNTGIVTINCANIAVEPNVGNVMYTGEEVTGVTGGSYITITGSKVGTEIGSYKATAVPNKNYCWSDGTTSEKEYTWNIQYGEYQVVLDNEEATEVGTEVIYGVDTEGVYLDNTHTKKMTSSTNAITIPTKDGYTFDGYYTEENGNGTLVINKDGYLVSDITSTTSVIYAKWNANTYTITLNNQNATSTGTTILYEKYADGIYLDSSYSNEMTISSNNITLPTKTGYTFGGYYTSTNGEGTQLINSSGYITDSFTNTLYNENVTLYAKWVLVNYTITYDVTGESLLPTGYTPVEYIESNGTQYIDTGVSHNFNDDIQFNVKLKYNTLDATNQIMGLTGNAGGGFGTSGSTWWAGADLALNTGVLYDVKFNTKGNSTFININDSTKTITKNSVLNSYTGNIYLFAVRRSYNETTISYHTHTKLYGAQIYLNDVVVRDFIPCYRNSDSVIGLYDRINKKFYTNNGSGTFTKGPNIDSYTVESETLLLPTPSKAGYTFEGWYQNSDLTGTVVTEVSKGSTGNKTFYAKWTVNNYSLVKVIGENIILNGDFDTYSLVNAPSKTANGVTHTWDGTLNGVPGDTSKAYKPDYWSNGGNMGVPVPEIGYHAHMRIVDNNNVVRYKTNEAYNGQTQANVSGGVSVTNGTVYTNRWLGFIQSIEGIKLTAGKTYVLTIDVYRVSGTNIITGGIYHATTSNTSYNFYSGMCSLSPTKTGVWETLSWTFTLSPEYLNTYDPDLFIYGQDGGAGELYIDNVRLQEASVTNKTYDSSYTSSELNSPTKTGYTFAGWYNNPNYSTKLSTSNVFNNSTSTFESGGIGKIYAKWTLNNYSITYNLNGGSVSGNPTSYNIETESFNLKSPRKTGYSFAGWTGSNDLSSGLSSYTEANPYVASVRDHMPGNEFSVTPGTTYRVFIVAKRNSGTLNLQGGIWYTGQTSGNAWDGVGGEFTKIETLGNGYARYYKDITVPDGKSKGKIYVQIDQAVNSGINSWNVYDMHVINLGVIASISKGSTGNKSYTANYVANINTAYQVQHYQMQLDGTYLLTETENKTGTTNASLTLSNLAKNYTGFTYIYGQVNGTDTTTTTVAADGSRIIKLYYVRNQYTVTLNKGTGISAVSGAGSYYYGASVTIDATVSSGYTWSKWSGTHSTTTKKYTFTMPASNVTDTANAVDSTKPNKPTISRTDFNTFSYSATDNVGVTGYYVSKSSTAPTVAATQSTFALNKWTTAKSTGNLSLSAGTYYVWARDAAGNRSDAASIVAYTVTRSVGAGSSLVTRYDSTSSSSGTSFTSNTVVLSGTNVWAQSSANTGYKSPVLKRGGSTVTNPSYAAVTGNVTIASSATIQTYQISFNANGGSGAPSAQTKTYGQTLKLSTTVPKRDNYTFLGWSTSSSATSATYKAGDNYTVNSAATLYAVWKIETVILYIGATTNMNCRATPSQYGDLVLQLTCNNTPTPVEVSAVVTDYYRYYPAGNCYLSDGYLFDEFVGCW